jgi:hypothetical protein
MIPWERVGPAASIKPSEHLSRWQCSGCGSTSPQSMPPSAVIIGRNFAVELCGAECGTALGFEFAERLWQEMYLNTGQRTVLMLEDGRVPDPNDLDDVESWGDVVRWYAITFQMKPRFMPRSRYD